jgi:dimethylamine monooxygenase subunit C
MLVSGIVSRPRYEALELDRSGVRHLLLADHAYVPPQAFLDANERPTPVAVWVAVGASRVLTESSDQGRYTVRPFRSSLQLLDLLRQRLLQEVMGLRLYALGSESFIWDCARVARDCGMDRSEYRMCHVGSEQRRVYCVHCRSMIEGVKTNIVPCPACGAPLLVRDHFSRRLSAFMGVQVDAEAPGEVPAVSEVFP